MPDMNQTVIESSYPLTFRKNDSVSLGEHLRHRHCVVLIGMKRVGISNFLRFFLNHKNIVSAYIKDGKQHIFIPVDLNDLVERELAPFWTLTLKRIVDACEQYKVPVEVKREIENLFLSSIQSQDLFLAIDSVRRSLMKIVEHDMLPTIFFLRFDRIKEAVTPEFFANLQGLRDAAHQKLSYVFTSFRSLDHLSPNVFTKASLSLFSRDMYIKPAEEKDIKTIFNIYKDRYTLSISHSLEKSLFDIVDGYVQYLQLVLISLHEEKVSLETKKTLFERFIKDERIILQSEELWESLDETEKSVLLKISEGKSPTDAEIENARYLWDTGFVNEVKGRRAIFSPLFDYYLGQKEKKSRSESGVDFSKKEHLLFTFLRKNQDEICEREKIIEAVWPEVEELGVSDWAIDRLVARVRQKLKLQKSNFEIQTVKTRGYKLITIH